MPEHLQAVLAALWTAPAAVAALGRVLAATPSPSAQGGTTPSAPAGLSVEDVSPGVAGFIATAAVVAASILVIRSMVGRLRRIRHRADVEAREEAQQQAQQQAQQEVPQEPREGVEHGGPPPLRGAPGASGATGALGRSGEDESAQRRAKRLDHLE